MGEIEEPPVERGPYAAPEPISPGHRLDRFDCGKAPLNDWLRQHALRNESKASRTYVIGSTAGKEAGAVIGYYTLAAGAVRLDELPPRLKRNMPNPVPVMILGRLAVDKGHQGKGLAAAMLKEALQRVLEVSRTVGVRAIVVHALDDEAVTFYSQFGFQVFPSGTRTLYLPVETLAAALR